MFGLKRWGEVMSVFLAYGGDFCDSFFFLEMTFAIVEGGK